MEQNKRDIDFPFQRPPVGSIFICAWFFFSKSIDFFLSVFDVSSEFVAMEVLLSKLILSLILSEARLFPFVKRLAIEDASIIIKNIARSNKVVDTNIRQIFFLYKDT